MYANLVLYGVEQGQVLPYLEKCGWSSYVSPVENGFVTIYDSSFEVGSENPEIDSEEPNSIKAAIQNLEDMLARVNSPVYQVMLKHYRFAYARATKVFERLISLDEQAQTILEKYRHSPEGVLVCWASHLSKVFSCTAFAVRVESECQLWYHLSKEGCFVDEYVTHATDDWNPGQGISLESEGNIRGGDARKLCAAFGCLGKVSQVEQVLRTSTGNNEEGESLREYDGSFHCVKHYPDAIKKHYEIALSLDVPVWWTVEIGYGLIADGQLKDYFDDDPNAPSGALAESLIKQALPAKS